VRANVRTGNQIHDSTIKKNAICAWSTSLSKSHAHTKKNAAAMHGAYKEGGREKRCGRELPAALLHQNA
jgi:hypothetical protein